MCLNRAFFKSKFICFIIIFTEISFKNSDSNREMEELKKEALFFFKNTIKMVNFDQAV